MATLDDEWTRLERHLELASGFWLAFLFANRADAEELRSRADAKIRKLTGQGILRFHPSSPPDLAYALTLILSPDPLTRYSPCFWIDATAQSFFETWDQAWANFVLRANERRDAIRRNLENSSLLIAAPPIVKHYFQDGASDLWSVRALVMEPEPMLFAYGYGVTSPAPGPPPPLPPPGPPRAPPEPDDNPLLRLAEIAAQGELSVLVAGPSLSGKRHVAQFIHEHSKRKDNLAVVVEAKEVNQQTFFGYVRGAFLGAIQAEEGLFERANKGSLILLMIEDLKPDLQEALVKVMSAGEVTRMGAMRPTKVDVRVIATTSADLEALCQQGLFRKDLYHRLSLMRIDVPAPPAEPQK